MKRWNFDADKAQDDNLESDQSKIGLRTSADHLRRLVSKGEAAIDEVLREQQQKVQDQQKKIFEELIEVQQLADHIYLLQAQQQHQVEEKKRQVHTLQELKAIDHRQIKPSQKEDEDFVEPAAFDTLVNVGSDVYLKAVGDDIGRIFVKTGFQFYLEMSIDEALKFLPKREKLLEQKYEYWSLRSARIKTQTQMVLHAIAAVMEDPAMQIMS